MEEDVEDDRKRRIEALEKSLDNAETSERKMRLNYLLAKFYISIDEINIGLNYFVYAECLLVEIGQNGLMNFRNFYRYRDKLEDMQYFAEIKSGWYDY